MSHKLKVELLLQRKDSLPGGGKSTVNGKKKAEGNGGNQGERVIRLI